MGNALSPGHNGHADQFDTSELERHLLSSSQNHNGAREGSEHNANESESCSEEGSARPEQETLEVEGHLRSSRENHDSTEESASPSRGWFFDWGRNNNAGSDLAGTSRQAQDEQDAEENFESLDFAPIHSTIFAMEQRSALERHFYGYTGRTLAKWSCTLAIGVMIGTIAHFIEFCARFVQDKKVSLALAAIRRNNLALAFLYYAGWGVAAVMTTSVIVIYFAPAAAGGGVTLVMAHLNGCHIPELLTFRTLAVKMFGTLCAVTSGLAMGPEGPLVHIGAAVATLFTSLSARFSRLKPRSRIWPPSTSAKASGPSPTPSDVPAGPEPAPQGGVQLSSPCPSVPLSRESSFSSSEAVLTAATPSIASSSSRQGSLPPDFDPLPSDDPPHLPEHSVAPSKDPPTPPPGPAAGFPRCFPGHILESIVSPTEETVAPPRRAKAVPPRHGRVARQSEITELGGISPIRESPSPMGAPPRRPAASSEPPVGENPAARFDPQRSPGDHGLPEDYLDDEEPDSSSLSKISRTALPWFYQPSSEALDFHNDIDRREFISAGAAAGLAAAFGAPVGGVLFSLEEASSFWSRKVMWRSLLCSTIACLTLAMLRGLGQLERTGLLCFHSLRPTLNMKDMPYFIVTAAVTGLLGGLFSRCHEFVTLYRVPQRMKFGRNVEAFVIIMLTIAAMFLASLCFGKCLPQPEPWKRENFGFEFQCPQVAGQPKQYNDLATIFFSTPNEVIKKMFTLPSQHNHTTNPYTLWGMLVPHPERHPQPAVQLHFTMISLSVFSAVYFFLFHFAYGMAMPGGLFMPLTILGATFGGLMGMLFDYLFPGANIQPGHHALIGATAMLGGVFRGSVSLVVIMVEGTGGIDFVFPIIIATLIANYVAGHFGQLGAYESDLDKLRHLPFLQSEPPSALWGIQASEIMSRNVVGFDQVVRVTDVIYKLRNTRHNGFPVYAPDTNGGGRPKRQLVGLILRSQLMTLLEHNAFVSYRKTTTGLDHQLTRHLLKGNLMLPIPEEEIALHRAMRNYHLFHHPGNRHLSSRPEAVDALNMGWLEKGMQVDEEGGQGAILDVDDVALDLRTHMNRSPIAMRQECSVHRIYGIVRLTGVRHMPIIDASSRVVGMITRKDLARAADIDHERKTGERSKEEHSSHHPNLYALP